MEPRSELAEASDDLVEHGHAPGTLDIDPKVAAELGLIEVLDTIRARLEGDNPQLVQEGLDFTRAAAGAVNGPAADAEICRLRALEPGVYRLVVTVVTGAGVSDVANLKLKRADIELLPRIFAGGAPVTFTIERVRVRNGDDLSIHAIGVSISPYGAQILATRVDRYEQP